MLLQVALGISGGLIGRQPVTRSSSNDKYQWIHVYLGLRYQTRIPYRCRCSHKEQTGVFTTRFRWMHVGLFGQRKLSGKALVGWKVSGWSLLLLGVNGERLHVAMCSAGADVVGVGLLLQRQAS
jgi:hypothetical protein